MSQTDLEGRPLPEPAVESEVQVIEYQVLYADKWRLKVRQDALEEIFDLEDEEEVEKELRGLVQRSLRVKDKKTTIEPGDFDAGVERMIRAIKGE